MSSCEKCWRDSRTAADPMADYNRRVTELYCTGEEQAGPDAGECPRCKRMTLHQYTREPMCGCQADQTSGSES